MIRQTEYTIMMLEAGMMLCLEKLEEIRPSGRIH
jgi:hypothetical protein